MNISLAPQQETRAYPPMNECYRPVATGDKTLTDQISGQAQDSLAEQLATIRAESIRDAILNAEARRMLEQRIADLTHELQRSRQQISDYRSQKRELQERLRKASIRLREKPTPKGLLSRLFSRPKPAEKARSLSSPLPVPQRADSGPQLNSYDVIASLGSWCGPAFNIREYYKTTKATPFDWWISDYDAAIKVLDDDFANIMRLENLEILDGAYPRETVRCRHYGIRHHHDFKREGDHGTGDGYHSASPIIDDLASQIENVQQKTQFILNRFRKNTRGADVLMVRAEPHAYPDKEEMALKLYEAFARCFNPRKLDLLIITNEEQSAKIIDASRGTIIVEPLGPHLEPVTDPFCQKNYRAIFDKIGAVVSPNR
ncbi:DUF1796 family putative cysteine peptidase [Sinorhizobium sp. M4_45]|uniref:DUF1796 family putative cysteine peptidase n=1 Tax=Sinorhizobium sp. M4_45 TaxID=2037901 RepID=UPI0011AEE056|nr:DUF1796 family putative cysteine peptidase [Sinorhizobium sp. M4_45]